MRFPVVVRREFYERTRIAANQFLFIMFAGLFSPTVCAYQQRIRVGAVVCARLIRFSLFSEHADIRLAILAIILIAPFIYDVMRFPVAVRRAIYDPRTRIGIHQFLSLMRAGLFSPTV